MAFLLACGKKWITVVGAHCEHSWWWLFWFDSLKSQGLKWYFSSMEEDTESLDKRWWSKNRVCVITNDVIQYFCHLLVCTRRQQKVNLNQQHTILLHEDLSLVGIWGRLQLGVRCGSVPSAETLLTVWGEVGPVQHWETPVPYGITLGVSKCWYGKLFFTLSWMARSFFVLCLFTQCIVKSEPDISSEVVRHKYKI